MESPIRFSGKAFSRWCSTGFMQGGVSTVDDGAHTLKSAVMVRPGEALGHDVWIDKAFCQVIAQMGNAGKAAGLKARFGHPNMCSDALGTFLGRWKDISVDEDGFVRGNLHLSSTAAESPKGDLRKYVEEMAAKEPDHFGASIVFSMDSEAIKNECIANGSTVKTDECGEYIDLSTFKSPDPANVKNLPHARCAELHAADLVDSPAATDGMFSGAGGAALAGQMTEWLDTHPDVFKALQEPGMIAMLDRYSDRLGVFIKRYQGNKTMSEEVKTDEAETVATAAETVVEVKPEVAEPTPESPTPVEAEPEAMKAKDEVAELTAKLAQANEQLGATIKADESLKAELDEAKRKLAAIESGAAPLSAAPKESAKAKSSLWEDARKSKVAK